MNKREGANEFWRSLIAFAEKKAGNMDALADEIKRIAHEHYQCTATSIHAKRLGFWQRGESIIPLWGYLAILHYCKDNGWQPSTEEAKNIYPLWAKGHPGITPSSFASDFNFVASEKLNFT